MPLCGSGPTEVTKKLSQFDYWKYPESDLRELLGWPDETLQAHVELLMHEIDEGARA